MKKYNKASMQAEACDLRQAVLQIWTCYWKVLSKCSHRKLHVCGMVSSLNSYTKPASAVSLTILTTVVCTSYTGRNQVFWKPVKWHNIYEFLYPFHLTFSYGELKGRNKTMLTVLPHTAFTANNQTSWLMAKKTSNAFQKWPWTPQDH